MVCFSSCLCLLQNVVYFLCSMLVYFLCWVGSQILSTHVGCFKSKQSKQSKIWDIGNKKEFKTCRVNPKSSQSHDPKSLEMLFGLFPSQYAFAFFFLFGLAVHSVNKNTFLFHICSCERFSLSTLWILQTSAWSKSLWSVKMQLSSCL